MRRSIRSVFPALLAVFVIANSGSALAGSAMGTGDSPSLPGSPNPASQLCIDLGGVSRAADRDSWGGSQIGLCRLQDDSVIDEWTLFRAVHGSGSEAVIAFLVGTWTPMPGPIETWADQACEAAGGELLEVSEHLRPGSVIKLCEFPDASIVASWTMFGGPSFYRKLARSLDRVDLAAFRHCPWPRTCMAPCQMDPPSEVLCRTPEGEVDVTSFACCCCGSGVNSYRLLMNGLEGGP